jgi:glutaryl-CoA dehydrogenase
MPHWDSAKKDPTMASTLQTAPAPPIDALDFLRLGDGLSDEERLIRDNVRAFVREQLLPQVGEWFEQGALPHELAGQLGALGVLGMHLEGYGCAGASATAYGIVCQELEAGDSGLRSFVSVQGSLAMFAIRRFGSEEQKQEWLPRMAAGEAIGCFGLTEPDAGSDPGSMRTTARRAGDDWVLNGTKMWITNGSLADVAVVWARTDDERSGDEREARGRIRGFLVPRDTPGFTTQDIHQKLSLRASVTSELILDDVRLPASARLPEAEGLRAPLACLDEARFGIVFGAVGAARACYEAALEYAGSRVQFGKPIAAFQLTQAKLAQMLLKVNQGALLALHLGRMKDAGKLRPEHVSFGKLANVAAALEVCREARQVLGANGITLEYPVIRHMNNLESVVTYEGTAEVHALVLGQAITGHAAYR